MTYEKKFRPAQVIAGIICVGFAFWFLVLALLSERPSFEERVFLLLGAVGSLWAAVQGLSKQ